MGMERIRAIQGFAAVTVAIPLLTTASVAHVTLAEKNAPVGVDYKAIFRVPHGCRGSATVKLSVEMPEGFIDVKPQPKPGWQIEIVKGSYAKSYNHYRSQVTEGVKSVTWSGGNLPDDYYDEFILVGYLDKGLPPGSTLYFPAVQTCEQGVDRWTEKPDDVKSPDQHSAPSLKLLPPGENPN
jgi:periplasmic copper chaperone A